MAVKGNFRVPVGALEIGPDKRRSVLESKLTQGRHILEVTDVVILLNSRFTGNPETIRFFSYAPRKS
jgi:hypothetical protein